MDTNALAARRRRGRALGLCLLGTACWPGSEARFFALEAGGQPRSPPPNTQGAVPAAGPAEGGANFAVDGVAMADAATSPPRPSPPDLAFQQQARRCRQSGGQWRFDWLACRCAVGQAFVVNVGCQWVPPPVPLDPGCPPTPEDPGAPAAGADAGPPAPARGGRGLGCAQHLGGGGHRWHLGGRGAAARAVQRRLAQGLGPEAPGDTAEILEQATLPADATATGLVHVDVAALQRFWPAAAASFLPVPLAGTAEMDVPAAAAVVPARRAPYLLKLWSAAPVRGRALGHSCRRLWRHLQQTAPEAGPSPCATLQRWQAEHAPPRRRSARVDGEGTKEGGNTIRATTAHATDVPAHAPFFDLAARPHSFWRHDGQAGWPWQLGGRGAAVLYRRLTVPLEPWLGAPGPNWLIVFFQPQGGAAGFCLAIGDNPPSWYDAAGHFRPPRLPQERRTP